MLAAFALLALTSLQDSSPWLHGPSPPPDRFDLAHDRALAEAWGNPEHTGPRTDEVDPVARLHVGGWRMGPRGPEAIVTTGAPGVWFLQAPGLDAVFVNERGVQGDPEERGWLGFPVSLDSGHNRIRARLPRDWAGEPFEVRLWKPTTRMVVGSWLMEAFPADVDGLWNLEVPLFNASPRSARALHVHFGSPVPAQEGPGEPARWLDGRRVVPLGMYPARIPGLDLAGVHQEPALLPLACWDETDPLADRRLLVISSTAMLPRPGRSDAWAWPQLEVDRPVVLIAENWGCCPELNEEVLAVARFMQQRIFYRTGKLPFLVTDRISRDTTFGEMKFHLLNGNLINLGPLDTLNPPGGPPGVLRSSVQGRHTSLRAADVAGVRLVVDIDPFFSGVDDPTGEWSVDPTSR